MRIRLPRSARVRVGLGVFLFFCLVGVIGPWIVTHVMHTTAEHSDFNAVAAGPSWHHLLGTTTSGQDCLAQLLEGARGSVFVGLLSGFIAMALAALVGVTAGFTGGITDRLLNAFANVVMTLPSFILLIIVAGYINSPSILLSSAIIGLVEWPGGARYLRAQAMSMRGRDFTTALIAIGESRWRILVVEVMPHLTGIISAMFLRAVVAGVFAQAGLAFLGIGGSTVSWGFVIGAAQQHGAIGLGLWWWYVPPGLCIALLGTATALVNFGVDEVSNPALRNASSGVRKAMKRAERELAARRSQETEGATA
ncbi:MAG: ABC transporter permease [Nocardioidaceae bacterium]|nr:ABC transporter permease [Nocardioidaceae bacterium]MCL2613600.1 ABC transporter permease [Nocardioidaceae bacterium]